MRKLLDRVERFVWKMLRNYMPRWTIFLFDEIIVSVAFISLWLFKDNLSDQRSENFLFKFTLAIVLFTLTSFTFKTHHGVVRFSTMRDLRKLVNSTIVATLLYLVVANLFNETKISDGRQITFTLWFPVVLGMMVIVAQLVFRFIVKSFFEAFEQSSPKNKTRAFILGSDYESVLLGNYLIADKTNPYKPVAFIAFKSNQVGKVVYGLPILSSAKGLSKYMEELDVKTLLLYKSQLDAMPKEFYDRCIVEGLELLMVSMFTKYGDEKEGTDAPQINKIKIEDLLGRNAIVMNKEKIEDQFEGQTILITGAAGSIGSEIAKQITQFHCKELILVDQAETPLNDLWLELVGSKTKISIKPIIASVSNQIKMRQIFDIARPSMVFHAAAYKHVPMMEFHPSAAVVTNVGGTKTVADLSIEFGVKRFVMVSTDKAVNPTNVMGATKRAAEIYIQSLHLNQIAKGIENPTQFVTTRFGNVLGSNGSVVPLFKRQIEAGGPVTVTHKEMTRYFMTIPEACSLVLEAGCTGTGGEIYIFDMGEAVKIYDLAEKMIRLSGKIPNRDIMIVETGLRPGEKLYEELLANAECTLTTYHKKVLIAKVRKYDYNQVAPEIKEMLYMANKHVYPTEVVKLLKKLIPEFKSQNSKYEELDKCEITIDNN